MERAIVRRFVRWLEQASAREILERRAAFLAAAVQPFIDTAISKTVNVPPDCPFEAFRGLYTEAWRAGLKGLAAFRPNPTTGTVLETGEGGGPSSGASPGELDPDRRVRLEALPAAALGSLRWRKRPRPPGGNPAWTYLVDAPGARFAVSIGHVEGEPPHPFEVWVHGAEQPRGLAALAKTLSMDMRSADRAWLAMKLATLATTAGEQPFELAMPPRGEALAVPSTVAALARLVEHRCAELGVLAAEGPTPVVDALVSREEPRTGTAGTLAWTVELANPATGDELVVGVKELSLPDGTRRPYALWLAGRYPAALDGLAASLSLDMRVLDAAWIGAKLRQLADFPEPRGDFLAWVPGEARQRLYPSTVAYLAALLVHRHAALGILDPAGYPPEARPERTPPDGAPGASRGRRCAECGAAALVRRDGCDVCTACGATGACG